MVPKQTLKPKLGFLESLGLPMCASCSCFQNFSAYFQLELDPCHLECKRVVHPKKKCRSHQQLNMILKRQLEDLAQNFTYGYM